MMKRKILISFLVILIIVSIVFGFRVFENKYKLSSELIDAILEDDFYRVEKILQDESVDVNFQGAGLSSFFNRPLERACLQYKPDERIIISLLNKGAKVYPVDYFETIYPFSDDSYDKIKILITSNTKPNLRWNKNDLNLLEYISAAEIEHKDRFTKLSKSDWQKLILRTYKLVYNNAEPFDKEIVLKSTLKIARRAKNNPLIEFIESEIAKLE